ncbi:MAG: exodeoxyribonuclease VII small subunit [Planctomycetaceae bacterium]
MAKRKSDEPQRFEEALRELESIARELDEGAVGLEESLRRFEQGVGLLRHCYGILDEAEKKIAVLTGFDGEGNPVLDSFDATATAEQGTAGRRKSRSAPPAETDDDGSNDSSASERGLF